jgi:predicted ATPase/DNA-binding CsgD family transcriptional regulator
MGASASSLSVIGRGLTRGLVHLVLPLGDRILTRRYGMGVAAEPATRSAGNLQGLTHARTSFVGRAGALDKVAGLLDRYRLVTVTGPGGVGKTRLADEVLKRVSDRFADGVWIVELASVQEPALVSAMVATVLGLHQAAGLSIAEALAARLSRQQVLLVLDNCEHVLDAVAELCSSLLLAADDIRILATSREPLSLAEEARYRLSPLTLPSPDIPAQAGTAEAVALFIERAVQIDPDLVLDGESAALVERLVRRLDGMPLAIELAAARVEALGLAQLLNRLDDLFAVLVSANRGLAARQRSLEAAVEWSYQLLPESDQRVFRCLSVFPGPFTLEAAEAVAGLEAGPAVLHLVDCSLLVPPRTGPDGRSRYSMLETLRSYATGRLRQADEEQQAASALAVHAIHVAERAAIQMAHRDQEQSAALWLDAEDAAVHQALAWALDHDSAAGLRLAVALAPWWHVRGRLIQGSRLLQQAIPLANPASGTLYSAHLWLGYLARSTFDADIALSHYGAVVDALRDGPPSPDLVDGLLGRCAILRNVTDLEKAAADAQVALDLARQIGYAAGEAVALTELGLISAYADDDEQAVEWARQAQLISREAMPAWKARDIERGLQFVLGFAGHSDVVLDLSIRALQEARAAQNLIDQADALYIMAKLARETGRLSDDAPAYLRESAEIAVSIGYRMRLIDILDEIGFWCAATGRCGTAVTLWSARAAHGKASGLANTPAEEREREQPLQQATLALDAQQARTAQERGAAMTLAAVTQFAIMEIAEAKSLNPLTELSILSARERELVALVAQGKTDAEIAAQLFISVSTVRTHLDRIRQKSGCRRRADLTRLALQEGII